MHFAALAFICDGLEKLYGINGALRMVVMALNHDGGHEEDNDEDSSYNDSIFAVGTGCDCACNNGAMPASCNGWYDAERALIKVI